jgi:hypothetical protein
MTTNAEHYRSHLARHGADVFAFEERAAIREFCGGQRREAAELAAYLCLCQQHDIRPEKPPRKT